MCIFKELRVVFGVFISPTLRHVLFIPQKMQETHFYVHMCDAQKRLYILVLHILSFMCMILIDIWLDFSVTVNLGQKLLEALFEHWPRGYWFMENQGTIIVHKLSYQRNMK